ATTGLRSARARTPRETMRRRWAPQRRRRSSTARRWAKAAGLQDWTVWRRGILRRRPAITPPQLVMAPSPVVLQATRSAPRQRQAHIGPPLSEPTLLPAVMKAQLWAAQPKQPASAASLSASVLRRAEQAVRLRVHTVLPAALTPRHSVRAAMPREITRSLWVPTVTPQQPDRWPWAITRAPMACMAWRSATMHWRSAKAASSWATTPMHQE